MAKKTIQEIIDMFAMLPDWESKYEYIIQLGVEMPAMPEELKTDDTKVQGCQSQVWMHAEKKDDKWCFLLDSDALITKGLAAIVRILFEEKTSNEIASTDLSVLETLGLAEHISPTRRNGLYAMINKIKEHVQHI